MNCAKCGKRIFRQSPVNANWCANDGVYLCRACAKEAGGAPTCPACRTPTSAAHPRAFAIGIILLILSSVFFVTFAYTDLTDAATQATPYVPVANVQIGTTVHTSGTIVGPPGQEVMYGQYIHAGKSSHWNYWGTTFTLISGGASLLIDASGISRIVNAPHISQGGDHMAYLPGDHVELIGQVENVLGQPALKAQDAAMGANDFWSPWEGYAAVISGLVLVGIGGAAIYFELVGYWRSRTHAKNLLDPNAFAYKLPPASPPPGTST